VELDTLFFLDDADKALIGRRRGAHNRLGFSVQLTTVRYVGRFLPDPLEGVPAEVIDYLAEQLGIADPSCVKRYAEREATHREHAGENVQIDIACVQLVLKQNQQLLHGARDPVRLVDNQSVASFERIQDDAQLGSLTPGAGGLHDDLAAVGRC